MRMVSPLTPVTLLAAVINTRLTESEPRARVGGAGGIAMVLETWVLQGGRVLSWKKLIKESSKSHGILWGLQD